MAQKQNIKPGTTKKKTSIGNSKFTKRGQPGAHGGNRHYKKKYRGQGR
jgi:hypothetical protein